MATRRIFADINNGELRLVITETSRGALEPLNLEFETIEDVVDYVVIYPETFSSELYAALLEALRKLRGGSE
jgi:hypothetical protein